MDQTKKLKTSSDESSASSSSIRVEKMVEVKEESVSYRNIQKADREKNRRDTLNEQFLELGNALDPNRPKSDKTSILIDTIQTLKELMTQVDRLKDEYVTLSQESRELVQEKSELREEKTSLKSGIEILNAQYRVRTLVPWIPHYTYPVPLLAITQCPVSTLPPFPLYGTQDPAHSPKPEQASSSSASNKQDCKNKSLDLDLMRNSNQFDKKEGVGLELELKIHASSSAQQDVSCKEKKENSATTSSSSNSYSSSHRK
ncbi:unnamed protein product [Eruca vesicaria subsp. sativa]|uniref:BHLH domain-containing protein n=1 Tax=Eruca vesicaria subsp. sativa TaxID=29727 RepID=A0ABC8JG56_ERUVS|nr:unnamed protein product [Eruca vesicaria subsp. sativa]